MSNKDMPDFSSVDLLPPFRVRETSLYPLIEDAEGKSLCFICMSEHMSARAKLLTEILNELNKQTGGGREC